MLVLSVLSVLCSNAVAVRRDKSILYARSIICVLICSIIITYTNYYVGFLANGIGLFHGLFHASCITHNFHIFIFLVSALILQLNSFYPRKVWTDSFSSLYKMLFCKLVYFNTFILNKMSEQFKILEYPLVMLFVIIGGAFLITSSDLVSIFLAIELQSYGLYILCSVYRESEKATSAGLTYFLLGGLSSCFILFASSLLYGNSGNTGFDGLYVISNISNSTIDNNIIESTKNMFMFYDSYYINFALVIMSVGFLFKVTAAPFHFWSPDVYDAIPTVVTTFVAIFAKISIFILILELVYYTNSISFSIITENTTLNSSWKFSLLLSAFVSFIIGSVLGMTQFRIKRLYAYSTISHVGFILLGISINSIESIQSFMFYLMQYSLSNLNAFLLLISIGYSLYLYVEKSDLSEKNNEGLTPLLTDKKNSPIQLISQLTGYFFINPVLALSLGITIFSFVGVPPLIGFFGKQMILSSALDNGFIFITIVAILTSVISAYYYLSLVKQIFFNDSIYIKNPQLEGLTMRGNIINRNTKIINAISFNNNNLVLSSYLAITMSILTLGILLFIINPQEWLSMINILSLVLFNN